MKNQIKARILTWLCGAEYGYGHCLLLLGGLPIQAVEIDSSAEFAFITDYASGKILMAKDADMPMKPASMAKIMTVFITFQRIKEGGLSLDDTFLVSEKAWRKGGSKTFIEVGKQVAVGDLLNGVIVQSGNDAAIALAEGISGTEEGFAEEMNFHRAEAGHAEHRVQERNRMATSRSDHDRARSQHSGDGDDPRISG